MNDLAPISMVDSLAAPTTCDSLAVLQTELRDSLAVPPAELLGAESRLIEPLATAMHHAPDMGIIFQTVVTAIALAYIISLVVHSNTIWYIIRASISSRIKRPQMRNISSEARNLERTMLVIGLLIIPLFVMRHATATPTIAMTLDVASATLWRFGGMLLGGLVALILVESLALYIIGIVSARTDVCSGLAHLKLLHFGAVISLITPVALLYLLTTGTVAQVALWVLLAECFIALILFIKETFLFFRHQRVSILHWILYLCALELIPISLLLAPFLRVS